MKERERKSAPSHVSEPRGSLFMHSGKRFGRFDPERNVPHYTPEPKEQDEPEEKHWGQGLPYTRKSKR